MKDLDLYYNHEIIWLDDSAKKNIANIVSENDRALQIFGRRDSQVTSNLMTLTMNTSGPYRRLRQCVAEINKRKIALMEANFTIGKKEIEIKSKKLLISSGVDDLKNDLLKIEIEELEFQIEQTKVHANGAMKDIAVFGESYRQIQEKYGISDSWDESDFNRSEMIEHLMSAVHLAFNDVIERGSISRSAQNYLEQFGVHPFTANVLIKTYVNNLETKFTKEKELPDIGDLFVFLDRMSDKLGDGYKAVMDRIGISSLYTEWAQYRTHHG